MTKIRTKVTLICFCFSLCIILLFFTVLFWVFCSTQKQNLLQSSRFNLQLTARTIDARLEPLQELHTWCAGSAYMNEYLRRSDSTGFDDLKSYYLLTDQYSATPFKSYISRLVVTDCRNRLLQVGNFRFEQSPADLLFKLQNWAQDHTLLPQMSAVLETDRLGNEGTQLIFFQQISLSSLSYDGLCYMSLSPALLTEPLLDYTLPENAALYLSAGDALYQANTAGDELLSPAQLTMLEAPRTLDDSGATQSTVRAGDGATFILVTYPIESLPGWSLSQTIPVSMFSSLSNSYFLLVAMVSLAILCGSLGLVWYLDRTINRPAQMLCRRIRAIAKGDFSADPDIEWKNELGEIGHGINCLSQDIDRLLKTTVAHEKEKRELEYRVLQNQVDPHFIYNTLNTIKWMATFQKAPGIAEVVTSFSRLLKSVSKGTRELIPLRDELALLNDYCLILRYRYGGGITVEVDEITDESLCDCLIPRFSLQPLAENAIFHGIEPKGGAGNIRLRILRCGEENLCIEMQDDGIGMSAAQIERVLAEPKEEKKAFRKIGLRNIHQRIQYTFGPQYGISIDSIPGEYTRVTLTLPCRFGQQEDTP